LIAGTYSVLLQALSGFPNTTVAPTSRAAINALGDAMFATPPALQNLAHLPLYGLLGLAWYWAFASKLRSQRAAVLVALCVSVGLGVVNEATQLFVLSRHFSALDLLFNVAGASLGVALIPNAASWRSR
jgi:VanZ family protein